MTLDHEVTLEDELHALAAPLRERLARVDTELATAEVLVRGLRENRSRIRTALRAVDPNFEPETKPGPKKGKPRASTTSKAVGDKAIERALRLLESPGFADASSNGGFTASELSKRPDWPFSQSYTAAILGKLHERGSVRLDHVGGSTGNAKFYALVK